jgi:putative addiction module component (TIGR02574 family)
MNKVLLRELLQLSPAERLEIAQELWDSLESNDLPPLTEEQKHEIERRLEEHERYPASARPWEEVREWLWSRRK